MYEDSCYDESEMNNSCGEEEELLPKCRRQISCDLDMGNRRAYEDHESRPVQLNCKLNTSTPNWVERSENIGQRNLASVVCSRRANGIRIVYGRKKKHRDDEVNEESGIKIQLPECFTADLGVLSHDHNGSNISGNAESFSTVKKSVYNSCTDVASVVADIECGRLDRKNATANDVEDESLARRLKALRLKLVDYSRRGNKMDITERQTFNRKYLNNWKKRSAEKKVVLKGDDGDYIWCSMCCIMFHNNEELQYHVFNKHVSKYHCDEYFTNKSKLLGRIRRERPFDCALCNRSFSQREVLLGLAYVHTTCPLVCPHCDMIFTQKASINSHLMTHHEGRSAKPVKPFQCQSCEKSFCYSSGLSRHMLQHTAVEFCCPVCNTNYTDASSLRRHVVRSHAETPRIVN